MPRTGAVIVAAGRSERMAGVEKILAPLAGTPLLLHAIRPFQASGLVDEIVVVTREDLRERVGGLVERAGLDKVRSIVRGGETRCDSSRNGLGALSDDVEIVLVHDAARPLVSAALIERVVDGARADGAAIPGVAPVSTIKSHAAGRSGGTLDRDQLREAQTPQGFRRELLARAFASTAKAGVNPTDEAACVEHAGEPVAIVDGERRNLKVTVLEDLIVAEALLGGGAPPQVTRIGFGRDVHRLVEGRPLILGGVEVPHTVGLDGWSDADVLSHAICDALLGAAALGDLGDHFPDTDETWRGVSGHELLQRTVEILRESGYVPVNVDATVAAQAPKLAPYRSRMIENLTRSLGMAPGRVSVKFTTTEGLGFEGTGAGISTECVALVAQRTPVPESG